MAWVCRSLSLGWVGASSVGCFCAFPLVVFVPHLPLCLYLPSHCRCVCLLLPFGWVRVSSRWVGGRFNQIPTPFWVTTKNERWNQNAPINSETNEKKLSFPCEIRQKRLRLLEWSFASPGERPRLGITIHRTNKNHRSQINTMSSEPGINRIQD